MIQARAVRLVAITLFTAGAWGCQQSRPAAPAPQAAIEPETKGRSAKEPKSAGQFSATAYSIEGKTATGDRAREGIVAADPKVLPLGTRIRVSGAGQYDGEYLVSDTGRAVKGREIDLYIASDREAKEFGRKQVKVEILGSRQAADAP